MGQQKVMYIMRGGGGGGSGDHIQGPRTAQCPFVLYSAQVSQILKQKN